ncbi:MAG: MFS transporter [Calditrichaeota bacterium]|nr:MAG: MFS transporter [Calditrichota bacterium]
MPSTKKNPWLWVPSLYYAEGLPYVLVMIVSVIMYKRLGVSNTDIALYTSWLYLPWTIKPLWSPIVDALRTKRFWIISMQLIIGAGLGGIALTIPADAYFKLTLGFFWLLAFSSATHDIAADGFYMLGLSDHDQAWFVGIRSTFYRLAMITGQGLLIILAGFIETTTGPVPAEFTFTVNPGVQQERMVQPDSFRIVLQSNEIGIQNYPEKIEVPTDLMDKNKVDSLVSFAQNWNENHGFTVTEEASINGGTQKRHEPSWFAKIVTQPLENFLRSNWGKSAQKTARTAEVGRAQLVYLHLSNEPPPDEEIIVNFSRASGDKSIAIIEGSRFIITRENWQKPCLTVIQLDPKLQTASSARFIARGGNIRLSWIVTFLVLGALFIFFLIYHKFMLPFPASDKSSGQGSTIFGEFFITFASFFKKKGIWSILAFLLFYRFAEAQLAKLAAPFLLDVQDAGGLALTTGQLGFVYGTVGVLCLVFGGLLGGFLAARHGLKYWLWWMVLAINIPNAVYIYLSQAMPQDLFVINVAVALEQFGYGFGFTAYMLYMIYAADGEHKTAHFAICTGFMALGMMLPGMLSGWLQDIIGYENFFIWVVIATIPSFIATKFIPIDADFGRKEKGTK